MQFETLQKAMITAMKARDKARKDAISSLVSDVKKAAIDAGTMIESGYAYCLRRKSGKAPIIVYYAETLGKKSFNLMLSQSADITITDTYDGNDLVESAYERLKYLPEWIENGTKVGYNGLIE